jgi:hypothetical protein
MLFNAIGKEDMPRFATRFAVPMGFRPQLETAFNQEGLRSVTKTEFTLRRL